MERQPVHVTVTGAAGQIGYQLVFRIGSGQLLGPETPVVLRLLEIEPAMGALEGVVMELEDCAFPLLAGVEATSDRKTAFDGASMRGSWLPESICAGRITATATVIAVMAMPAIPSATRGIRGS